MAFPNLVIGQFNELAVKAGELVCADPGVRYPLMIIYGELGTGKTALLNSIEEGINNKQTVKSLTSSSLMDDLIHAIKRHVVQEFSRELLNFDVLSIDDIQDLTNKTATQDFLFHIIRRRLKEKKQTILTSRIPIKKVKGIDPRLSNIILESLSVEILKPNFEERLMFIKHFSKLHNISFYEDVITLLAERCKDNLREIAGAIIKLKALNEILKIEINLETAEEYIK